MFSLRMIYLQVPLAPSRMRMLTAGTWKVVLLWTTF
jgi:hypothetical protein